jgi:parallel beta-helix repeat protein
VTFYGNVISGAPSYAIFVDGAGCQILNNTFLNCVARGIYTTNASSNNIIAQNIFVAGAGATAAIELQAGTLDSVIEANVIDGAWTTGIKLVNGDKNVLSGNRVTGATTGINIDSNSDRNITVSNNLYGSGTPLTNNGTNGVTANNLTA